ncbi:MAG: HAMP domain-containing sensor histidine kinase, partial [Gemmatimonadota bacterium]
GAVVIIVCAYSNALHSRAHYDELDRMLHGASKHVADELQVAAPNEYPEVLSASQHLGTAVRLFDSAGRFVLQSSNATVLPAFDVRSVAAAGYQRPYSRIAALAPSLHRDGLVGGAFGLLEDMRGNRWRVFVDDIPQGQLLVALQPLVGIDESVRRFGQLMVIMAAIGSLLTFGAGWLVARRALRPVAILTDAARSISRSQAFTRRVEVTHPRDELGRLATTFNEMLASLETAYAAQQRFASDASHELRAPLTILQANLELLRRTPSIAMDEREHALAEASAEADRLARLVADLLILARADAGQTLRRGPVELDRVLMDVLGEARHLTRGQRLEVGELVPLRVTGDADRLKQLVLILIDNAIKYTPAPGRITLSLRRDDQHVRLTVRDSGVGIPAEALPHVFERFYRADPARSRDPGGTGLGLAIARWIVLQHGGEIKLASEPDRGTTAVVMLPA